MKKHWTLLSPHASLLPVVLLPLYHSCMFLYGCADGSSTPPRSHLIHRRPRLRLFLICHFLKLACYSRIVCVSLHHLFCPLSMLRPRVLFREEECEDGIEEAKEEETPVTESDSDEREGADTVSKETTPRYFRKWWLLRNENNLFWSEHRGFTICTQVIECSRFSFLFSIW